MRAECPPDTKSVLKKMPTDDNIDILNEVYGVKAKDITEPAEWGDGIVWSEFHHSTPHIPIL